MSRLSQCVHFRTHGSNGASTLFSRHARLPPHPARRRPPDPDTPTTRCGGGVGFVGSDSASKGFGASASKRPARRPGGRKRPKHAPQPTQLPPVPPKDPAYGGSQSPRTFHAIASDYPRLEALHTDPAVYGIPGFLTDAECDRLVAKAGANLLPCVTVNPRTGAVEEDPNRTSTNANVTRREVPSIVAKLCALGRCGEEQLETLQVLKYTRGQFFYPHTDGFEGPATANGFEDSARLVTVFVYLNDVAKGGETRFTELGLDIRPRKGMAVIHLPTTLGFEEDERTEHEGAPAVDDKWLLVTWVWMHARTQAMYAEENFPCLSEDRI